MPDSSLTLFPSPCGEKVGINTIQWGRGRWTINWFPSPCGEKVGINIPEWVLAKFCEKGEEFPSPCGEKVGINLTEPGPLRQ